MPTKVTEYSMYSPGKLVIATKDLYSSEESYIVSEGTVGMIMNGPNDQYQKHYRVQFLNNIEWWVNLTEIEPYLK